MRKETIVMRKTRRIPSLFASIAGLALIASTGGAVNAAPGTTTPMTTDTAISTTANTSQVADQTVLSTMAVGEEEAADMTAVALSAIANNEVSVHAPMESLKASESKVSTIATDEGDFTTVTVPVGGPYSLTSNVAMVFDSSGDRLQYTETLVSENQAGNFAIATYLDGAQTSNQDTDLAFMTDAELEADLAASQAPGAKDTTQSTDKNTGACIATVLGVGGVVGSIIAYSCAGACAAAAAGVGVPFCVACIAGFATVGGASVTAVATCF